MASPKELASLGVKERFRKLGWFHVTLIAGFVTLVSGLVELVRYESYQDCATYESLKMLDAWVSQYAKEHVNKQPELVDKWIWTHEHFPAQRNCSHKYRFDLMFVLFDRISALRVFSIGILTAVINGVITSFKGWPVSAYIGSHPEVVTNILDLISFIFVTPQLLSLANATNALISAFGFGDFCRRGIRNSIYFDNNSLSFWFRKQ
jgi:hypothetical protein